ncbi:FTR1 family iron permease [Fictibacillus enclensis]|uniref:FTR1 family iron permease n=1 Tax=Fictibacillus enclensis TaxID=1017270 RepID=UPI0024C0B65D|nr:FTR1 family protein [Fictibacillus enclensis]WHY71385.1 FTR1 family protein [Fictibacillus enclensis]
MLANFWLSFREGLEAALVIGIILTQIVKMEKSHLKKMVYIGALAGFLFSLVGGYITFNEAKELEGMAEEVFEGVIMLVASGLIAFFILWLHKSSNISQSIQSKVANRSTAAGILILSFLSVFREGMELAVFNMTQISQHASALAGGSIFGIAGAVLVAYLLFKTTLKLNLQFVFKALGIILIVLGGEMFAEGLEKLIGGEIVEITGLIVFIIPSLSIFLKQEIQRISQRKQVGKAV